MPKETHAGVFIAVIVNGLVMGNILIDPELHPTKQVNALITIVI
jgi:hypothetical protein